MEGQRIIKFYTISKLFKNNEKQLERGENAYNSGHVKTMNFLDNITPPVIKGQVYASMKNKFYDVEISIDFKNNEILTAHCSCPRGVEVCHHMAALLYFAHYNISSTDTKRAWGVVQSQSDNEVQTVEEMFGFKETYKPIVNPNKEKFITILGAQNMIGFSWLLRPEADETTTIIPSIEDIISSEEFRSNENKHSFFCRKCELSYDKICTIAQATVGQNKNECWLITRKNRITASNFGMVLKACKRNRYPPSLYKSLMEGYDMERALAVQWGITHQESALNEFVKVVGVQVEQTGLWLDRCGFLGASPDGLIGEDAILEIKCPYSMRSVGVKEYLLTHKYFFKYENDDIIIDSKHIYYDQIQGQLYCTGRQKCYFFVWTPKDYEVFLIDKDKEWGKNIGILKEFYLNKFLEKLFHTQM